MLVNRIHLPILPRTGSLGFILGRRHVIFLFSDFLNILDSRLSTGGPDVPAAVGLLREGGVEWDCVLSTSGWETSEWAAVMQRKVSRLSARTVSSLTTSSRFFWHLKSGWKGRERFFSDRSLSNIYSQNLDLLRCERIIFYSAKSGIRQQ